MGDASQRKPVGDAVSYSSWQNFQAGSPGYYGANGNGVVPPWMQQGFSQQSSGGGTPPPWAGGGQPPTQQNALRQTPTNYSGGASQMQKWQDQLQDKETPEWFQSWMNQWNRNQQQPAAAPQQPGQPASQPTVAAASPWTPQGAAQPEMPQQPQGLGFAEAPAAAMPPAAAPQGMPETPAYQPPATASYYSPPAPAPQPSYGSAPAASMEVPSYAAPQGGGPGYDQSAPYQMGNTGDVTYHGEAPEESPSGNNFYMDNTGSIGSLAPGQNYVMGNTGDITYAGRGPESAGSGSWGMDQFGNVTQNFRKGGQVKGYAKGGLASAVDQVQSYGRGPDTMLAHITPDESHVIDYLQGGRKTNPVTGLPEYSMFGDILKAVARAAAGIGGFMVGGPMGAAAASAAATKLTGGSWNDALKAGAFSGIGSFGAQGLGGGGWGLTGAKAAETAGTTLNTAMGEMAIPDISIAAGPQGLPGSFGEFMSAAKSAPGIAAGLGGLSVPTSYPAQAAAPQMPEATKINLNVKPQPREYMPYQGDPLHFAEPVNGGMAPGMGHKFYSPLLPIPQYQDQMPQVQGPGQPIEGLGYANGGMIRRFAMGGPTGPKMPGLQGADMPGQPGGAIMGPNMPVAGLGAGIGVGNPQMLQMRRAALAGYNAFAKGGAPHEGPVYGPGTGTSDSVPARLSAGEHVMTEKEISLLGGGDNERGQKATYALRRAIKKNPAKVRAMVRGLGGAA